MVGNQGPELYLEEKGRRGYFRMNQGATLSRVQIIFRSAGLGCRPKTSISFSVGSGKLNLIVGR